MQPWWPFAVRDALAKGSLCPQRTAAGPRAQSTEPAAGMSQDLSPYELQRLENIKRNQ